MSAPPADALQMFYNEDFSPEDYVDALHASLAAPGDRYAAASLARISATTQDLVTLLDYNTTEILREMAAKVEQVKRSSAAVGGAYGAPDAAAGPTRLQYYVDSLRNAVETLQGDVAQAQAQVAAGAGAAGARDPVDTLIQLKGVRRNIAAVCDVLTSARDTVAGRGAVSEAEFADAMRALHESLRDRLRDAGSAERARVVATVRELRAWVPMFQPFARFGPAYVKCVAKLEGELDQR